MAKYDPLKQYLMRRPGDAHTMDFDDVADLVGGLPPSAYRYSAWWSNHEGTHVQTSAWLAAGWRVNHVDFSAKRVSLRRAYG